MGITLHDGRRKTLSQPSTRHGNPDLPLTLIGTVRYLEMRYVERSLTFGRNLRLMSDPRLLETALRAQLHLYAQWPR
ncbi:MAG: hypothetical protein B7Y12_18280 [Rhizobiales bacterium 24-66-13]|nr:MAG: hypothetical protein B7Y12_18280 [Rhizobiales bacterium 24-66-13]